MKAGQIWGSTELIHANGALVWQDEDQEGLVDETILEAGDFTQVKPGKVHQFEGLEDGVAFELYWAEFSHNDIIRRTIGTKI